MDTHLLPFVALVRLARHRAAGVRAMSVHLIAADDARADQLMAAARRSAALVDRRNLRVLDADRRDDLCYVVNEWGTGESLDKTLANDGPLSARRAAWAERSLSVSPVTTRRSRMPVRVVIHSSDVSRNPLSIWLVTACSGSALPTPMTRKLTSLLRRRCGG